MFGPWSAAPPKTADSMMEPPPREMHSSASAPEEIYRALEGTVLPYQNQLPGVGGGGGSILLHSRRGTANSSHSGALPSSSRGPPPALHIAIPGAGRMRSASDASSQPFAPSTAASTSPSQGSVPWRSVSTRSAPHYAPPGAAPRYVPYARRGAGR